MNKAIKKWNELSAIEKIISVRGGGLKDIVYDEAAAELSDLRARAISDDAKQEIDQLARLLINSGLYKLDDIPDDDVPGYARTAIMQQQRQLSDLRARLAQAESNLRFYDGLIMGDGDHDKIMLARDGSVFLACFRALGMDARGTDTEEIPEAIIRLKAKLAQAEERERKLEEFVNTLLGRQAAGDHDIPLWVYQQARTALTEGK
jgi:hypothetical protein